MVDSNFSKFTVSPKIKVKLQNMTDWHYLHYYEKKTYREDKRPKPESVGNRIRCKIKANQTKDLRKGSAKWWKEVNTLEVKAETFNKFSAKN